MHIVGAIDIRVRKFPEMVPKDCDRHNQRDIAEAILLNHLIQFCAIIGVQFAF